MSGAGSWLPDWSDAQDYTHLEGVDRAGLMWEWLRRDPHYVAWHARASEVTRGAGAAHRPADDVAQWGVHFR